MESVLPPDPYKALGVPKDADAALIKSTYRKLVLKCHPDKVADVNLKKQAQEEFHKIQQAWEAIGDEEKRKRYDLEFKLEQARREKLSRSSGSPNVEVKATRYDVRTQAPAGASFPTSSSHRYEEHKPTSRSSYDDRYYEERARKYDTYEAYPKHGSSRSSREKDTPIRVTRVPADRTRSDHKKSHDKEQRRDRERRFVSVESESSTDEKAHYEAGYRRRSDDARKRADEDEARRQAADARKRAEEQRRSYDDSKYEPQRKYSDLENDAMHYINRTKADADRPSPGRTSSSREYYERSSRRDRTDTVRRSSARPKDRKGIEIVDWEEMKIPSFKHSSSSPAELHVPRTTPQRSYTESSRDHRRTDTSPTPQFRRADTMPSVPHASSSRRKEPATRSSTLRESGPSSAEAYPTVPPPASSTKYYQYTTSSGGVRLSPEDVGVANGHRTVLHEPNRHRTRSPSPLSRPPMGANRPSEGFVKYTTAAPKVSTAPPLNRSATINVSPVRGSDDRGRPLYGEIPSDRLRRESARRQTSFSPEQISFSQRIGPDDIRWSAPRGRDNTERDREYAKPSLARHATFVY